MANSSNKDQLLHERIMNDFQAEGSNADDLVGLVHILLRQNDKQDLLKEIKDIYEDNPNVESFVDWVWDLYAEKENQGHEETKSEYSDVTDQKAKATTNQSNQPERPSNDIRTTESKDEAAAPVIKRSRPAIYDEYERNEKLENLRNVNRMANQAKSAENNKRQNKNNNNNNPNNRQNNNMPPNPHMNNGGRKPQPPPAVPKEEPKKLGILDRIVKPGDKAKVISKTPDNAIVLNSTKQEKIIKKVKPNPETKQINYPPQHYGGDSAPTKPKHAPPSANTYGKKPSAMNAMNEEKQEQEQDQGQGQGENAGDSQKLKIRCRNWPNCKNEATCQYHHPTENCKNFPACRFGDKCLYIHPAIHCKFGAYCQRPNCAYVHPKMPAQMQYYGFQAKTKRPVKAHFGNPNQAGGPPQQEHAEANGGEQNEIQ